MKTMSDDHIEGRGVEVYTRPLCGYSTAAIDLLDRKGAIHHEIARANRPEIKPKMIARANGRATFPQIFIAGRHIGGYDDLAALERSGKLDALLAEAGAV